MSCAIRDELRSAFAELNQKNIEIHAVRGGVRLKQGRHQVLVRHHCDIYFHSGITLNVRHFSGPYRQRIMKIANIIYHDFITRK